MLKDAKKSWKTPGGLESKNEIHFEERNDKKNGTSIRTTKMEDLSVHDTPNRLDDPGDCR
jgi:hypothetical protein